MRLLTFAHDGGWRLGVVTEEGVADTGMDAAAFYRRGEDALVELRALVSGPGADVARRLVPRDQLRLGPPVPAPSKILCVGLNYARHARESGMDAPAAPVLFSKFPNALAAHGDEVPVPAEVTDADYEAELVAVVGRRVRDVSPHEALSAVLGYCNGNDVSARALQFRSGQWLLGKTLDAFMPIGPELVTTDEVPDPQALSVRCWVNGELRQDSSTADMIFSVAEIVAYASRYMTLEPGDVISTGTPEGVAMGMSEPAWLKAGDVVTVEVGPLGRLENRIVGRGS